MTLPISIGTDTSLDSPVDLNSVIHAHSRLLRHAPNYLAEINHTLPTSVTRLSPWLVETRSIEHLSRVDLFRVAEVVQQLKAKVTGVETGLVQGMMRLFDQCRLDIKDQASDQILRVANCTSVGGFSPIPFKLTQEITSHNHYCSF